MVKSGMNKLVAIVGLAALAACASTDTTDTGTTPPTAFPKQTAKPQGPAPGSYEDMKTAAGHRVFFGYNQYSLTPEAQATLRRQAAWLKQYPETRIRLEGNCDERGTREYNLALGARRANAAKAFLIGLGVDASRVTVVSNGKERPIDRRSTPDAWSLNRNSTTVLTSTASS